jgi:hypothetical protein
MGAALISFEICVSVSLIIMLSPPLFCSNNVVFITLCGKLIRDDIRREQDIQRLS